MQSKKDSQFEIILNELDKFEKKLTSEEMANSDDGSDDGEFSSAGGSENGEGASSCSFEDIDT